MGEFGLASVPGLAAVFGLGWVWGDRLFAAWTFDFVLVYAFGIVFQYFSIAPMRGLGLRSGLWAAVKADTFSITSWQVGMYGVMALAQLWLLPLWFGGRADALGPVLVRYAARDAGRFRDVLPRRLAARPSGREGTHVRTADRTTLIHGPRSGCGGGMRAGRSPRSTPWSASTWWRSRRCVCAVVDSGSHRRRDHGRALLQLV